VKVTTYATASTKIESAVNVLEPIPPPHNEGLHIAQILS